MPMDTKIVSEEPSLHPSYTYLAGLLNKITLAMLKAKDHMLSHS